MGATAALSGPQERWWSMDLGPMYAAVFGFTLWTGAWLFAPYSDGIFSPGWWVAERHAWAIVTKTIRGTEAGAVEIDERDQRLRSAQEHR